jgi:N-acetylglucosaminyldiphosphoundecaprenol N-acetyl-beta-D-mannosaminyltransferase
MGIGRVEYRLSSGGRVMAPKAYSVLGCPCIPFVDAAAAKHALAGIVTRQLGGYSVAINAEKIERFDRDPDLRSVISGATLLVADGAGAVIGLRLLHGVRTAKIDLPRAVLEASDAGGWRLFIGGASESVNEGAARAIAARYPGIRIVGRINGYVTEAELLAAVSDARPQIMMLAMGSPRQELIAARIIESVPDLFIIGCGGALDILAGKKQRAPRFMVENNLEWLYRLYQEPSRWRRQLVLLKYILRLAVEVVRARLRLNGRY